MSKLKEIRLVSTQKTSTTDESRIKGDLFKPATEQTAPAQTTHELLRIVRAAQPIPRVAVARRLGVHRRRITVLVRPLIDSGILREGAPERSLGRGVGRPPIGLSLRVDQDFLIGVNIGVSQSHIGAATVNGNLLTGERFPTNQNAQNAIAEIRSAVVRISEKLSDRCLAGIGISVVGPTDSERSEAPLRTAPRLEEDVPRREAF